MTGAVAAEQKAYLEANSKVCHATMICFVGRAWLTTVSQDEYEQLCQAATASATDKKASDLRTAEPLDDVAGSGVCIGSYNDCRLFADGATSEVYRSGDFALKVIVVHQNMEPHNPQR